MNALEIALFKTRKNILETADEIGYNYDSEVGISLKQCSCCGIWLKTLKLDLDGLDICNTCLDHYGP